MKDIFIPNKSVNVITKKVIILFWICSTFILWFNAGAHLLPSPFDIVKALKMLIIKENFIGELLISTTFCMKAMVCSIIISFIVTYLSVLPFFRPFCSFIAKMRFLSTAGLTFFVGEITPDSETKKLVILSFAITVFLVTSMLAIVLEVKKEELDYAKKEELDYARSLRMNEWKTVWAVIIRGKMDMMFEVIM